MDCREHVVLLTGATGRIGSTFARYVLDQGGRVAAVVRRAWQVAKLQESIGSERVLTGVVQAHDGEAAAGFVKGCQDALGPITAFVGVAGEWRDRAAGHEPAGDLLELLEGNLVANATMARAVLPGFRRRRRGTLTFLGAPATARAKGSVNYLASKAALVDFVWGLARELQGSGVGAVAIVPAAEAKQEPNPERIVAALAVCAFTPCRDGGALYVLVD